MHIKYINKKPQTKGKQQTKTHLENDLYFPTTCHIQGLYSPQCDQNLTHLSDDLGQTAESFLHTEVLLFDLLFHPSIN